MHGISARKIAAYKDICSFFSKSTFNIIRGFGVFRAYVFNAIVSSTRREMGRCSPANHSQATLLPSIAPETPGLMFALPGAAPLELMNASTIMGPTIFAGTILLHLSVRRQLDRKEGASGLGAFRGSCSSTSRSNFTRRGSEPLNSVVMSPVECSARNETCWRDRTLI